MKKTKSIEPVISELGNGWLKSHHLDYKLEQGSLNHEIDKALNDYLSKSGGSGGNRPDVKLLIQDKELNYYPVLIEYKGGKDQLVKINSDGFVDNQTSKNEPNFKNIKNYAVNGAIHYANAILHHTGYTDVIAIGMTGHCDEQGKLHHKIGVYFVSKDNLGSGKRIGDYSDFSFLANEHFDEFIVKAKNTRLSDEELKLIKERKEKEINSSLIRLNNDIYQNESGLGENDRVYLVAASIISTIGIPGKVRPLEKSDLESSSEIGYTDGDIILKKIESFLRCKNLPEDKKSLILRTLQNTLSSDNLNKPKNGETQLKRVFSKIVDDLGIYYKIGLTTDFTGKLFNEMYSWLGFTQDKLNDVVLTPSSIANLLVKLARVNKDSYVWDFATGSAGLLVAAMNEMLMDAKDKITSPDELRNKELSIKAEQLLGLELLPSVYMLAVLNMILMGDGSSNIINKDSLRDFDGKYGFGLDGKKFPANAFILNPPYSAPGKGMIFVEKALSMMDGGYAAIITHSSAGTGKAKDFNKEILKNNTLLSSIKMPRDLFIGKANVQTYIYVFKVNEPHHKEEMVKFIDFSNDGYIRTNRRKSNNNLRDVGFAKDRYQEVVDIVRFGCSKRKLLSEIECFEDKIDPNNGADWNKTKLISGELSLADLDRSVSNYFHWEISSLINSHKNDSLSNALTDRSLGKIIKMKDFKLGDLFEIKSNPQLNKEDLCFVDGDGYPYFTRTVFNNGILGYVEYFNEENKIEGKCLAVGMMGMKFFYMEKDFYAGQFTKRAIPKGFNLNSNRATYFTAILNMQHELFKSVLVRDFEKVFTKTLISLPVNENGIDFDFIENAVSKLRRDKINHLSDYLGTIKV